MDGVKPRLSKAPPHARPQPSSHLGTSLNSSPLLRLLAGLGVAEVAPPALSLAERWSPWLAWTDAITLSAVLGGGAAAGPGQAAGVAAAINAVKRLRQELTQAIHSDSGPLAEAPGQTGPASAGAAVALYETGLASLRRRYQAQQRAMDERIAPVRAQLRATLTGRGGNLARLAALDAVLDQALAARQRRLLATVPGWLDKHFKRAPTALPAAAAEWQRMLLAELDLRLQPVEAMIEALAQAATIRAGNLATKSATKPATNSAANPAGTLAKGPE